MDLVCGRGYFYFEDSINPKINKSNFENNEKNHFSIGGTFITMGSLLLYTTIGA